MDPKMLPNAFWKNVWVAVRFALFGVFGFIVMFGALATLLDRFSSVRHEGGELSPFLLVPLSLIGALMMLFGVGEWGRWGYLLVFVSIPTSLSLLFLMPTGSKEAGILVPILAVVVTYSVVRRHYARRKNRGAEAA